MRSRRFWVSAAFIGTLAVLLAVVSGMVASSHVSAKPAFLLTKADSESAKNLAGIANEGPDATLAAQQEAERAYPADSVPLVATENSIRTFKSLRQHGHGHGQGNWQSIGPSQARYPAVLDQFLAGGKPYVASGRVTALAIGGCKRNNKCSLYLGAAGGGVWSADRATDGDGNVHWQFMSGSFGTNAIGSLLVDPATRPATRSTRGPASRTPPATRRPAWASTSRPTAATTGRSFPGSDLFPDRAVGHDGLRQRGEPARRRSRARVRGISSVTGGASRLPDTERLRRSWPLPADRDRTFTLLSARRTSAARTKSRSTRTTRTCSIRRPSRRRLALDSTTVRRGRRSRHRSNAALSTDRAQFALDKAAGRQDADVRRRRKPERRRCEPGALLPHGRRCGRRGVHRHDDAAEHRLLHGAVLVRQLRRTRRPRTPNVVYLGGSFDYDTVNASTNGRAVLLSTDGGATWSDMTRDSDNDGWIHPDQHALVTVPGKPLQFIDGDDGGVVRSNGRFVDGSAQCDSRAGSTPRALAYCKSLLCADPGPDDGSEHGSLDAAVPEPLGQPAEPRAASWAARRTTGRSSSTARPTSGRRSSTATAASPAGTRRTAICGSTRSPARRTT